MKLDKIKKIILKSFDDIYISSIKISKEWGKESISLIILENIIGILKNNLELIELREAEEFVESYNKTLNTLFDTCKKQADKFNTTDVSKQFLKECISVIKESFSKGYNK